MDVKLEGANIELGEFVAKRCESALLKNKKFIELERNENSDPVALQIEIEDTCYMRGLYDGIALMQNSHFV